MKLSLSSRAKTVPDNYSRQGMDTGAFGPPGYSLTEEQMNKAQRMESEYYDWRSYEQVQNPQVEHPEYRSRGQAAAIAVHWERIVSELEPMPRGA